MSRAPKTAPPAGTASEARLGTVQVSRMFGLPEARLRYWSQTGFIVPSERAGGRRYYGFRDLVAVKVAKELLDAGHPLQAVRRSLDALKDLGPDPSPLARFRIRSEQGCIVVDGEAGSFEPTTGQLLLDFDVQSLRDHVAEVRALPWVAGGEETGAAQGVDIDPHGTAYDAFVYAVELEATWAADEEATGSGSAFEAVIEAYNLALERDPHFAAAWTNLGAVHAQVDDLDAARDAFDEALRCDGDQPEARCNLAELALRAGDADVAIEGFRALLQIVPDHLEAHYGLARALLEVGGRAQAQAHLERFCAAVENLRTETPDEELEARAEQARAVLESLVRERSP